MHHADTNAVAPTPAPRPDPTAPAEAPPERTVVPAVDATADPCCLRLWVDLPGVARDAASVTVEQQTLTIEATTGDARPPAGLGWGRWGRTRYRRKIHLGVEVDATRAEARLDHGVLALCLPKAARAARQRIAVATG